MQKSFVLVAEQGRENFELAVNERIAKGFVPSGSMSISTFNGKQTFYQPMVRADLQRIALHCVGGNS